MRTVKTLIRLGGCPSWSESSLGAHSFCWFCHVAAQFCFFCEFSFYFRGDPSNWRDPPPPTTDWFFYVGVGRGRFYEESWMKDALYVLFCNRWSKKISMANSNPLFLIDLAQKYTFIKCFCLECHWYKSFKVVITVNVLKNRTVKS